MPRRPRVVMVDDDKLVTRSFANSFSDAFDLIQVNSPDLAMQAMDESVQVAVVDERMPGKSGIELLCELKPRLWSKPVLIRLMVHTYRPISKRVIIDLMVQNQNL